MGPLFVFNLYLHVHNNNVLHTRAGVVVRTNRTTRKKTAVVTFDSVVLSIIIYYGF